MTTTRPTNVDAQVDVLKNWLLGRERNARLTGIDLDLDLIDARVLDSLDFLTFVHLLEEITARELQIDAGSAFFFRTLRSIRDNILGAEPGLQPARAQEGEAAHE